jgi:ABC-2 type transport system permease protein
VKDVLLLALTDIATAIRERITLFWFLVFPVFMLVLLSLIFGQIGQEGEINFDIALINRDTGGSDSAGLATMIVDVVVNLATPQAAGQEPLFTLHQPGGSEAPDVFLDRELTSLRRGRRAAVVVIPEGFGDAVLRGMAPSTGERPEPAKLTVYMSRTSVASEMATEIIEQVLGRIDREILIEAGRFDPSAEIQTQTLWLGQEGDETRYIDFLLPGIVLMAFFTTGLFGVPGVILFNRDRKVLRRYWVTPLSVPRFLAGFSLGHLSLCGLQFALLFLLGRYGFGATVSFAQPAAFLTLILAAVTFMAFGFLIASLARTANAGMATANVLNMPMMFLSGMFFPVAGLPAFLKGVVYANPVSYLVNGLRASVGVESSPFSPGLLIGVPLAWIALSALVAARKLKWDVQR